MAAKNGQGLPSVIEELIEFPTVALAQANWQSLVGHVPAQSHRVDLGHWGSASRSWVTPSTGVVSYQSDVQTGKIVVTLSYASAKANSTLAAGWVTRAVARIPSSGHGPLAPTTTTTVPKDDVSSLIDDLREKIADAVKEHNQELVKQMREALKRLEEGWQGFAEWCHASGGAPGIEGLSAERTSSSGGTQNVAVRGAVDFCAHVDGGIGPVRDDEVVLSLSGSRCGRIVPEQDDHQWTGNDGKIKAAYEGPADNSCTVTATDEMYHTSAKVLLPSSGVATTTTTLPAKRLSGKWTISGSVTFTNFSRPATEPVVQGPCVVRLVGELVVTADGSWYQGMPYEDANTRYGMGFLKDNAGSNPDCSGWDYYGSLDGPVSYLSAANLPAILLQAAHSCVNQYYPSTPCAARLTPDGWLETRRINAAGSYIGWIRFPARLSRASAATYSETSRTDAYEPSENSEPTVVEVRLTFTPVG